MSSSDKSEVENRSPWDSFKKIPETLTSLANGIGTMANQNKLFDTDEWSKIWTEATQEEEMPEPKPKKAFASIEQASIEQIEGGAEESSKQNPLDTFTALQDALKKNFENIFPADKEEVAPTSSSLEEGERGGEGVAEKDFFHQASTFIQSIFPNEEPESHARRDFSNNDSKITPQEQVIPGPEQPKMTNGSIIFLGNAPSDLQNKSTPPAQSEQEKIKQDLEAKINEGVTTGVDTTEKETFEHKVKNLYAIFSELKYKKIDEILHVQDTSAQEKIDEVKKFQENFRMDLRIDDDTDLENALTLLISKIEQNNLDIEKANSKTPKYTPSSYDNKDALFHLTHSKHYLDGILQDDGIDAGKRITAAKLFVKQLELVSDPSKSGMADMHKQFVQYQADESSGDSKKIVDEGAKFAKSIEALASGDESTSFLDTNGKVLTGLQGKEYHFHDSVVKHEVGQRNLVIRKFTERLSELSSVLKSEAIINNKIDEIFDDTKIIYEINPLTKKITFTDPNPPVGAVVAGVGAGAGADAPAADAAAAGADTPAVAPANPFTDISFVGLSNLDIYRRLIYLGHFTEGIMEAKGKDGDKKNAIKSLIAEMKLTTDPKYSAQNACYQNYINLMTSDENGQLISEGKIKNIGKDFLGLVKINPGDSFLMSNIAMQGIYSNAKKILERESTEKTNKEKEKEKAGDQREIESSRSFSFLSLFSRCFSCIRLGKTKELTKEEKKRKTALLKLVDIQFDNETLKFQEPNNFKKNNYVYRITKVTMDNILTQDGEGAEGAKGKLELLSELMSLRTDSVDNFFDDFSKNSNFQVPSLKNYAENQGFTNLNSENYLQKFCKAILDSKNENGIDDNKKLEALKLFLEEQNNKKSRMINKEIADGTTDEEINTKAQTFLEAVSKKTTDQNVYSDYRIKVMMEASKTPTADPAADAAAATTTPAPAAAAAAAASTAATGRPR